MKKTIPKIVVIITLIAGLSLLLYPTVSNLLKSIAQNREIEYFNNVVAELDTETYDALLSDAEAYNADLASREYIMLPFNPEDQANYDRQLKLPDTDVMGYIMIPKIGVSLPIYHGTSEAVLQNGVGHLEGSSMPVGGESTHAVLSGHRGLPSARLFTDLDRLVIGDTFSIRVLRETLTYEIDNIITVLPEESAVLQIVPGMDYCTLVTCTPYGVNSHRLLVRGHRIPTPEGEVFTNPAQEESKNVLLIVAIGVGVLIILAVVIILLLKKRGKNDERPPKGEKRTKKREKRLEKREKRVKKRERRLKKHEKEQKRRSKG